MRAFSAQWGTFLTGPTHLAPPHNLERRRFSRDGLGPRRSGWLYLDLWQTLLVLHLRMIHLLVATMGGVIAVGSGLVQGPDT